MTSAVNAGSGEVEARGPVIVVRPVVPDDYGTVFAVHESAFPTPGEARLVAAIRAAGRATVSLVAEVDGQVVGHILFSPVTIENDDRGDGVGLAPVAVLPAYQRRGIGSRLIRAGLEAVTAAGMAYCVVLGAPAYYQRFGFRRASDVGLANEYGVDEEFMVIELRPGGLAGKSGQVRYCAEFATTGV